MKHSWDGYVQYAWGRNELAPLHRTGVDGSFPPFEPTGVFIYFFVSKTNKQTHLFFCIFCFRTAQCEQKTCCNHHWCLWHVAHHGDDGWSWKSWRIYRHRAKLWPSMCCIVFVLQFFHKTADKQAKITECRMWRCLFLKLRFGIWAVFWRPMHSPKSQRLYIPILFCFSQLGRWRHAQPNF